MQALDSSLAFYSLQQAEEALKNANRWFNHVLDESIALQRAMLEFELKPMEVDDAVALWFPVVKPMGHKRASQPGRTKQTARASAPSRRAQKAKAPAPLKAIEPAVATAPQPRVAKRKTISTPVTVESAEVLVNDLKLIAGIGPGLEKKLNAAGITSYAQIAALSPEDISRLERDVVKFAGRITRDDWIRQAQQLLAQ